MKFTCEAEAPPSQFSAPRPPLRAWPPSVPLGRPVQGGSWTVEDPPLARIAAGSHKVSCGEWDSGEWDEELPITLLLSSSCYSSRSS